MNDYPAYPAHTPIEMPAIGSWPAAVHRMPADAAAALRAAEATGRPLLIRGLPGVGKSMTARAAAHQARRPLIARVIDNRTEPDDLKARFDAVRRLADAQARGSSAGPLAPEADYLSPLALWWAFDWAGALAQQRRAHAQAWQLSREQADQVPAETLVPVPVPSGWQPHQRSVLLLDEIDKGDPELPNALLEALGNGGFTVPVTGQAVQCPAGRRPLIIVTTNEERELPAAFLRRCLVLWLALPEEEGALVEELVSIGTAHQQWLLQQTAAEGTPVRRGACRVIRESAVAVARSRRGRGEGDYLPGTSEFLDLVAALADLWPDQEDEQRRQLAQLEQFTLHKLKAPPHHRGDTPAGG